MLLPCEDNLLRNITIDRPACRVGRFDSLACDIESALLDVIEKEIDLQRRLDILKRELETRYDYSTLAAYRSIDKYNDGRIDTHNLGSFLRSCGHYASERELLAIIRRMDTDGDARLSYAEFSDFVRSSYPPARASPADAQPRAESPDNRRSMLQSASYSSPLKSSTLPRAHSAHRHCSPVRCSPVRCSPVRCSPVRCSPVRCSPVRCSPVRCAYPCAYPCCTPVRCSPVKPILHVPEEDALVNGLRDIIALERELESTKVTLTNKPDFNLHDAFRIFDVDFRGYISAADIREGLSAIGVFPTSDEVDLFLARYDGNKDLRLNFNEFADAFLSTDSYYSHMLNRRPSNHKHPIYRRDDCFYADTQVEFRNMWRVHFKVEVAAEAVRQRLQRQPCFNVYEAFNSLDLNDDGRVNASEIKRIIESRGFYVSEKEASSALDKFDKHKMGSVTYSEVSNLSQ